MGNDERMGSEIVASRISGKIGPAHGHRADVVTREPGIAGEELALIALVQVKANAGLIVVIAAHDGRRVYRWAHVSIGIKSGHIGCNRIDHFRWNLVVRKRDSPGSEIDQRVTDSGEVSFLLGRGWHHRGGGDALPVTETLVITECKDLILSNRASGGCTELVLL